MNVLFIGDLRPALNYGAIATSDCLMKLVGKEITSEDSIKFIEYKSFIYNTPPGGWGDWVYPKKEVKKKKSSTKFKRAIILVRKVLKYVSNKKNKKKSSPKNTIMQRATHVPSLWREYERFYNQAINGNILQYEMSLLNWADVVIINSEGNLVHGIDQFGCYKPGARYVLFISYLAKKLKKHVSIVNHVIDPEGDDAVEMIKNVYPSIDTIWVRDPISKKRLIDICNECKPKYVPDAVFSFETDPDWEPNSKLSSIIDFSNPYVCLGDSSGIQSLASRVKWDIKSVYSDIVKELQSVCPQIIIIDGFRGNNKKINDLVKTYKLPRLNLYNCPYEDLIEVLGRAKCFISGRWHATIMGLLSGTPFVSWGSDSHKTYSLTELFEYPFKFYNVKTLPLHISDIRDDLVYALKHEEELRAKNKEIALEMKEELKNMEFIAR